MTESIVARVVKVERGAADCLVESDAVRAVVSGQDVCTGDWAHIRFDDDAERWVVDGIEPRRSAVRRASKGGKSTDQVLAANVDTVAVAIPLDADARPGRVERYLAVAWSSGALPVLVLTKADLCHDVERAVSQYRPSAPGVEVVAVRAASPESVDELREYLLGTVALIGPSGAGKSTLANALLGRNRFTTGAVREGDRRGRHTTVHRELVALPGGGSLIDTPGLREIALWDAESGIEHAFADIEELAEGCRFADCAHEQEPGCAVESAIDDGLMSRRRLDSYRKLLRENDWMAARTDARARSDRTKAWKQFSKQQRRMYVERGRR